MSSPISLGVMLFSLSFLVQSQQQTLPPPVRAAPSITQSNGLTTCPPLNFTAHREMAQQGIQDYYQSDSTFSTYPPCSCGGTGDWTRAVYLNMSDINQQCPDNLTLITTPVRGCGRKSTNDRVCDSVTYEVNGRTYSQVCGRILGYQKGLLSAFYNSVSRGLNNIEAAYLSGLSLTHGLPGSRQHIWSFVGGLYQQSYGTYINEQCPCSAPNYPYQVPSFINNDYFCDSGNPGPGHSFTIYYTDAPLWDGQGCGTGSTCCQLNNPPWFCMSLPQPTNDDLEIRNCATYRRDIENFIISLIDIYVK